MQLRNFHQKTRTAQDPNGATYVVSSNFQTGIGQCFAREGKSTILTANLTTKHPLVLAEGGTDKNTVLESMTQWSTDQSYVPIVTSAIDGGWRTHTHVVPITPLYSTIVDSSSLHLQSEIAHHPEYSYGFSIRGDKIW